MNLIRSIMTFFLLILIVLAVSGWIWAGGQPAEKMSAEKLIGARLVLGTAMAAAIGSMFLLWKEKEIFPV